VSITPVSLLTKLLPDAFNAGIAQMQKSAESGDERAKTKLADVKKEPFAFRVTLEGKGGKDVYVATEDGKMTGTDRPPSAPITLAVGLPLEAAEIALEEFGDEIKAVMPKLEKVFSRYNAAKAKPGFDKLAAEKLKFHLVIKDTPDFEEVRVKVAIGESEPPAKGSFTVSLDYETFEKITAGKIKPQNILGSLQISGDSARAMQLAMELMQGR
jgi:putative sterol carrier protein